MVSLDAVTFKMHSFTTSWRIALRFSCTAIFFVAVAGNLVENKTPKPLYTFNQLWELENGFWDAFLYPANLKQTQGNQSTIFAPDVRTRSHIHFLT